MIEPRKAKVDLSSVINRTYVNQCYFKKYQDMVADARQSERRAANQCHFCFYASGRVGGAMCTTALCAMCDKEMRFGSTCVDVLCAGCAADYGLCLHCGADREMKARRKLERKKGGG